MIEIYQLQIYQLPSIRTNPALITAALQTRPVEMIVPQARACRQRNGALRKEVLDLLFDGTPRTVLEITAALPGRSRNGVQLVLSWLLERHLVRFSGVSTKNKNEKLWVVCGDAA